VIDTTWWVKSSQHLINENHTAASHWEGQIQHPEWPCIVVKGGLLDAKAKNTIKFTSVGLKHYNMIERIFKNNISIFSEF
jgi:hypothetical protein